MGLLVFCLGSSLAQELTVHVRANPASTSPHVLISGNNQPGSERWVFPNTYGAVIGLGNRVRNLRLKDGNGQGLVIRNVGVGDFRADRKATEFAYEVDLSPPTKPADAAHVSWLNNRHGYFMLADLLPDLGAAPLCVEFELPQNWTIVSSAQNKTGRCYEVNDKAGAVFFVGNDLKQKSKRVGGAGITFVTAGEWPFSSNDAIEKAARIIKEYNERTGYSLRRPVTVMLSDFPGASNSQGWSAETRGENLVLLASRNPSALFSLGQLSVVLCHELFHLWVPNALSLTGDFDWFFEGFTLYQALRTAVRLGLIDFQEYLNTLGRVYASYLSKEHGSLSLIEASQRRWTSGSSLVYDQGMLAAFLFDLRLRKSSGNQLNLDNVYQQLLQQYGSSATRVDGNEVLVSILAKQLGDAQFVKTQVQEPSVIDLESALPEYGFRVINSGKPGELRVAEPLTDQQYQLLKRLGYRKR